ncbi:Bacteriocin-like peptide M BlpM [Streptococcus pneumoniae SPNA45]|nr:Bacteriocin-like peptide M BlpM [Streptococcus pneumoniae SPNA45]
MNSHNFLNGKKVIRNYFFKHLEVA